jgi:8-oxo-(d)GTP phosphatase
VLLLLVRHGDAGDRGAWVGDDTVRPLSPKGRRQADALVDVLSEYAIDRVVSSPYRRCVQTVEPLAAARGLPVIESDTLGEGHRDEALALVDLAADETVVLCGHGDTVPYLLIALGVATNFDDVKCSKASTWVVRPGQEGAAEYLPPPKKPET